MDFTGRGVPLSEAGIADATGLLGVEPAALWACLRVETSGCGFLPDRRPAILFERHIFHKETGGNFDLTAPEVSAPESGGYGDGGAHQYTRLASALLLNRAAALKSASWGIGQVMGLNAEWLGYRDVEDMVAAMLESEDNQLHAMTSYIEKSGLDRALQQRDWTSFARQYNGPQFAKNHYAEKLNSEWTQLITYGLPDLRVRSAQLYLTYRGINPGPIDGTFGDRTRTAVRTFQQQVGLTATGKLDDTTLARLAGQT